MDAAKSNTDTRCQTEAAEEIIACRLGTLTKYDRAEGKIFCELASYTAAFIANVNCAYAYDNRAFERR